MKQCSLALSFSHFHMQSVFQITPVISPGYGAHERLNFLSTMAAHWLLIDTSILAAEVLAAMFPTRLRLYGRLINVFVEYDIMVLLKPEIERNQGKFSGYYTNTEHRRFGRLPTPAPLLWRAMKIFLAELKSYFINHSCERSDVTINNVAWSKVSKNVTPELTTLIPSQICELKEILWEMCIRGRILMKTH